MSLKKVNITDSPSPDPSDRDVFYRERNEGTYGTVSFFISYLIAEVPFEFASIIVYSLITSAVIGLKTTIQAYLIYVIGLFCLTFSGESLGMILCSLFQGVGLANTVASIILSVGLLASGSFVPIQELPGIVRFFDYAFITTYLNQVFCANQFVGAAFVCPGEQALPDGSCPYSTGEQVLDSMGVNPDLLWPCLALSIAFALFYRFLALIILRFKPVDAIL